MKLESNSLVKVSILDYGMGNILSVKRACEYVGMEAYLTNDKSDIEASDALLIPGVGAFDDAIIRMKELGLIDVIHDFKDSGRLIVGICLGMQLLMDNSDESKKNLQGLGFIKGKCKRFPNIDDKSNKVKVPQIMWNQINFNKNLENSPFHGMDSPKFMYFVHSYYVEPVSKDNVLSLTNYGGVNYASSIINENVIGFQFHPEKSGDSGLKIYKNIYKQIKQDKLYD